MALILEKKKKEQFEWKCATPISKAKKTKMSKVGEMEPGFSC